MNASYLLIMGIISILIISGCVSNTDGDSAGIVDEPSTIKEGDTVKVSYVGEFEDGTVFDSTEKHGGDPLEFTVGKGQVISGFDDAVIGMKTGEEKEVRLEPSEAYGEHNPELVMEIPRGSVPEDVEIGDVLGMLVPGGQQVPARVIGFDAENVTIDMNHEMAGKVLIFRISIVEFSS